MNDADYENPQMLHDLVERAVRAFNDSPDRMLLHDEPNDDGPSAGAVGEQAIAHRFAVHLEQIAISCKDSPLHGLPVTVDCEYNRHRGAVKKQKVKEDLKAELERIKGETLPEKNGWYHYSVRPDVIIHRRGNDDLNLVVIELKRSSNTPADEFDRHKLKLFTTKDYEDGYGYALGLAVVAFDEGPQEDRKLKVTTLVVNGNIKEL